MGGVFAKSALPGKESTGSHWEKAYGRMTVPQSLLCEGVWGKFSNISSVP